VAQEIYVVFEAKRNRRSRKSLTFFLNSLILFGLWVKIAQARQTSSIKASSEKIEESCPHHALRGSTRILSLSLHF